VRIFAITVPTFLPRENPISSSAKPACIQMTSSAATSTQIELMAGDIGDVICRGGNRLIPEQVSGPDKAELDHISYGIAPWDVEQVRAALESRGLSVRADTATAHIGPDNKSVPDDIYQAAYQSYQTLTPNGFPVQISWVTRDRRLVGAMADKPQALRKYPAAGR